MTLPNSSPTRLKATSAPTPGFLSIRAFEAPAREPSLRILLEEGLGLMALFRNGAWPQPQGFRERLEAHLAQFELRARERGKAPEAVAEAKYAFCALADELLLGAESPFREEWSRAPLQLSLFGEHLAGEGFFDHLDRLRKDPTAHGETLEVFHACLLLGFQGKYLLEAPEQLHWLTQRLGQDLARVRGPEPGWSPHAIPAFRFAAPGRREPPLWGFFGLLGGVAILLFLSFKLILHFQTLGLAEPTQSAAQPPPLRARP